MPTSDGAYKLTEKFMPNKEGSSGNVLLAPGKYAVKITEVTPEHFEGGGKIPKCFRLKVTMEVDGKDQGTRTQVDTIALCSELDWKIASFFTALGFRDHGEEIDLNWHKQCVGREGWVTLTVREFASVKEGSRGQMIKTNDIGTWCDPATVTKAYAAPSAARPEANAQYVAGQSQPIPDDEEELF